MSLPSLPLGHVSPAPGPGSRRRSAAARLGLLLAALALFAPLGACAPLPSEDGTLDGSASTSPAPSADAPATSAPPSEAPAAPVPPDEASTAPTPSQGEGTASGSDPARQEQADAAADGTALAQLAGLEEKGRGPTTDYDRELFGWREDMDRNGCDTRNDILRRDLTAITLKGDTNDCVVLTGTLASPYSGGTLAFDRENSTVDIDHVVALSDAWQTGAASWDEQTMREFGNDPLNLLAVEAGLNRQKGDGDAATWLPPKKDYRCEYVARQIAVKDKYGLWVKPAEADAMERVLGDCEGFLVIEDDDQWPATGEGDVVATEEETAPAPAPDPGPAPAPTSESSGDGDVHFPNCTAAREAGAAPVRAGDPGYAEHLDGDGDGVGCE